MDELIAEVLPDDWDVDDELLVCPHGHAIELDGECPDGCVSPLRHRALSELGAKDMDVLEVKRPAWKDRPPQFVIPAGVTVTEYKPGIYEVRHAGGAVEYCDKSGLVTCEACGSYPDELGCPNDCP